MTSRASMNCYHSAMDLEIRHLQLVAAIAETGSVTRAGERLNLSQSALSHQLRDIEDRLNTALFHRVGRRMVLTPAGEEVRRAAAQVIEPAGIAPGAVQMVQLTEAIIELVKAGLGIAAMARWAVRPHLDAGTIRAVRLTRSGFKRRWRALTLRGMAAEPFIKDFIDLVARRSPSSQTRVRKSGVLRFEH